MLKQGHNFKIVPLLYFNKYNKTPAQLKICGIIGYFYLNMEIIRLLIEPNFHLNLETYKSSITN